ncbi:hypothetical protein [Saccharopolyspora pogona]|uniref:hypothetical protein n=1 Tax=Saccharopolyspora pogona TaxID=333966 RepID=UPI00168732AB|nr:hypothetical protein [Saccharopolyspora pogona]
MTALVHAQCSTSGGDGTYVTSLKPHRLLEGMIGALSGDDLLLPMRAVAECLDVGTMSLYRHVAGRLEPARLLPAVAALGCVPLGASSLVLASHPIITAVPFFVPAFAVVAVLAVIIYRDRRKNPPRRRPRHLITRGGTAGRRLDCVLRNFH